MPALGVFAASSITYEDELSHVGVKAAVFSFSRLKGVDPVTGVEMASTGEVGCIAPNFEEALYLSLGLRPLLLVEAYKIRRTLLAVPLI